MLTNGKPQNMKGHSLDTRKIKLIMAGQRYLWEYVEKNNQQMSEECDSNLRSMIIYGIVYLDTT